MGRVGEAVLDLTALQVMEPIWRLDKQVFDLVDRCNMNVFFGRRRGVLPRQGPPQVGAPEIVDAIKNNLCGKVRRELVPGTLEVYPLAGYGAVETGVPRFVHSWEQDNGVVGEAKFIHIWQYKGGTGKITRVTSSDHHEVK